RTGRRFARRPHDHLPCRLRAHGGAARVPHRELLRRPGRVRARIHLPATTIQPKDPPMKRFHVHVNVHDLDASIRFYSNLFATAPSVVKPDYAKWMLDDPRVNFAISRRDRAAGLDHLGVQAETAEELADIG